MSIVEIIPGRLYAGGRLDEAGWMFVAQHVNAVLNLRPEPDTPPFDFSGRLLIWAPIPDKAPPDLSWVFGVTGLMNALLDAGHALYVHDTAGINRLGFVLTAFYMQRFCLSASAALAMLRRKKPDLRPNPLYWALLSMFEPYVASPCQRNRCHACRS